MTLEVQFSELGTTCSFFFTWLCNWDWASGFKEEISIVVAFWMSFWVITELGIGSRPPLKGAGFLTRILLLPQQVLLISKAGMFPLTPTGTAVPSTETEPTGMVIGPLKETCTPSFPVSVPPEIVTLEKPVLMNVNVPVA